MSEEKKALVDRVDRMRAVLEAAKEAGEKIRKEKEAKEGGEKAQPSR